MDESNRLLLFGASTRAAAFSALRAGLKPWCVDLFADRGGSTAYKSQMARVYATRAITRAVAAA